MSVTYEFARLSKDGEYKPFCYDDFEDHKQAMKRYELFVEAGNYCNEVYIWRKVEEENYNDYISMD